MTLTLRSRSFDAGEEIPRKHTADGAGVSPALAWTEVPAGTKSLALVVHDPDAPDPKAPRGDWVHWVLYNLPPSTTSLPEDASDETLPEGTRQGLNDSRRMGWVGPSPPAGRHRYVFTLYALDTIFYGLVAPTRVELLKAMEGRILEEATLTGMYGRGASSTLSPEASV